VTRLLAMGSGIYQRDGQHYVQWRRCFATKLIDEWFEAGKTSDWKAWFTSCRITDSWRKLSRSFMKTHHGTKADLNCKSWSKVRQLTLEKMVMWSDADASKIRCVEDSGHRETALDQIRCRMWCMTTTSSGLSDATPRSTASRRLVVCYWRKGRDGIWTFGNLFRAIKRFYLFYGCPFSWYPYYWNRLLN